MSHQATFACPSCGASLTAQPGQTEVQCGFCGAAVIVPESLRTRPMTPPPVMPAVPPPEIVVVEQPPTVIYQQAPSFPMPGRRRRTGCGCCGCGCLGPLISMLVLVAIGVGVLYAWQPDLVNKVLTQAQSITAIFSSSPEIIAFTASPSGTNSIIVLWATNGDNVQLDKLSSQGNQTLTSLPPAGEHTYNIGSNETGQITFRLTATKNGQSVTKSVNVTIRRR